MARLKCDGYRDFQAGMRFIESLATWLQQFEPHEEETAYALAARPWLPQLTTGRRRALGRLYDFIDPHDTCPIFPFPASNPRLGDTSAEEYLTELEDTWSVDNRHRLRRDVSRWMHLESVPAPQLADTCGAGDWCTAGLIAKTAVGGRKGFRRAGARGVRDALRYGQALAAWNCGFEGARGGMYAVSRQAFKRQITNLIDGRLDGIHRATAYKTIVPSISYCDSHH